MKVLITGSSGLIGSALAPLLEQRGYEVVRLVRARPGRDEPAVFWDPNAGLIDAPSLEGLDAVVHLAGESIAGGLWTARKKARIFKSRVAGTRLLVDALARLKQPPRDFLCASAIGYYGDRSDEVLREESGAGAGFLASVVQAWEEEAARAGQHGMRAARLRIGLVLTPRGGLLKSMLPPFRLGLGARLGSGRQYASWIAFDDLLNAIAHVLESPLVQGPVNLVGPNPVTNRELTRAVARAVSRPAPFVLPALLLRVALREMAQDLMLASARVEPAKLTASGFSFRYPDLAGALRHLLSKAPAAT